MHTVRAGEGVTSTPRGAGLEHGSRTALAPWQAAGCGHSRPLRRRRRGRHPGLQACGGKHGRERNASGRALWCAAPSSRGSPTANGATSPSLQLADGLTAVREARPARWRSAGRDAAPAGARLGSNPLRAASPAAGAPPWAPPTGWRRPALMAATSDWKVSTCTDTAGGQGKRRETEEEGARCACGPVRVAPLHAPCSATQAGPPPR